MNKEVEIEKLKTALLFEQEDDIDLINQILNNISHQASNEVIKDLCALFNDDIEEISVVGDMIETILYVGRRNDIDDGVKKIIESTVYYCSDSVNCFKMLYHVLLNSEDLVEIITRRLQNVDHTIQQKVKDILIKLATSQPELFATKVEFILKG